MIHKTDQMYHKKDPKKIKMEEFSVEIDFRFGVPMIILDLIHGLTGHNIIDQVKNTLEPPQNIIRMNPDAENFMLMKN